MGKKYAFDPKAVGPAIVAFIALATIVLPIVGLCIIGAFVASSYN